MLVAAIQGSRIDLGQRRMKAQALDQIRVADERAAEGDNSASVGPSNRSLSPVPSSRSRASIQRQASSACALSFSSRASSWLV